MSRKTYVPDPEFSYLVKRRCPKCGQMGLRSITKPKTNPKGCWIFRHQSKPSFIPGVNEAVVCFVPVT